MSRSRARMLALLRVAVFVGALVWVLLSPIPSETRWRCALLLVVFGAYSLLITRLVERRPARAGLIYRVALVADILFLFLLFGQTGGMASPFLPAAFLLGALTAFAYGPALGILAAWAALGCAALSDFDSLPQVHWSEVPLLVIFVTLTAGYVGWLAQREASERRDIERLHGELRARAGELAAAYHQCEQVRDHLVHSERLATIGQMSAEMAHQVRNPLSSISLNMELLEDAVSNGGRFSADEMQRLIASVHKEIDALTEVTESYLRFAKLPDFNWEWADLNELVRDVMVFAGPQIEARAVKVSQRLEGGLPPVRLDRRQFRFAVMNVLSNAFEAMERGGRLRIRTCREGPVVSLMIADTGVGISAADMPRIFDPFFTTKQGGTGLGLSLVRRIVEAHGGYIGCKSISQVGTTFTVSLPTNGQATEEPDHGGE